MSVITRGGYEEVKKAYWDSRIISHCPQFFIDPMAVICFDQAGDFHEALIFLDTTVSPHDGASVNIPELLASSLSCLQEVSKRWKRYLRLRRNSRSEFSTISTSRSPRTFALVLNRSLLLTVVALVRSSTQRCRSNDRSENCFGYSQSLFPRYLFIASMGLPIVYNIKSVIILLLAVDAQLPAEQQIEQRAPRPKIAPVTVPVYGKRVVGPLEAPPPFFDKITSAEILRVGLGPIQGLRLSPESDSWHVEPMWSKYNPEWDIYLGKFEFDTTKLKDDFLGSYPAMLVSAPIHCSIYMPGEVDPSPLGNLAAVVRLMGRIRGIERWNNEAHKKSPSDPDVRFIEAEDENGEKNFDRYCKARGEAKEPGQIVNLPAGLTVVRN
ncbi:hypothetical protein EV360DRAFT_74529 [Lentinula raphanica]|nr:hypothetical protein EV360DRAFT_74529 [Lentinula raphanica]